jgi:hypothetical protein
VLEYADQCAERFGLARNIVPGGNEPLRELIIGEWDEDIVVAKPGEKIREEDFDFNHPE